MRRFGIDETGLVRCSPRRSGDDGFIVDRIPGGGGTWTKYSSESTARFVISGGPLITKASCSRSLRQIAGIAGLCERAMKRYGRPRSIVTDRLRLYRLAMKVIGNTADQECCLWLNNRAENSHQPFRRRGERWRITGTSRLCRSSLPFTPRYTTTTIRTALSAAEISSRKPLYRSGRAASACGLKNLFIPHFGDWFALN